VRAPRHGLAVAGFVVALCGAVFSLFPIIFVMAWPLGVIGLVLAACGWRHKLGKAGVILGVFSLVLALIWTIATANAVNSLDTSLSKAGAVATAPATPSNGLAVANWWTNGAETRWDALSTDTGALETDVTNGDTVTAHTDYQKLLDDVNVMQAYPQCPDDVLAGHIRTALMYTEQGAQAGLNGDDSTAADYFNQATPHLNAISTRLHEMTPN
jgi:hypothetical protein